MTPQPSGQPRTRTGRAMLRQDYRGNESYPVTRADILAIEAEMYDHASNDGYHAGIADCKEHDPAHRAAAPDLVANPPDRSLIRAAISNAYYECREAGGSMEAAADQAAAHVMDLLADPVASPDYTEARNKLATILHQRESAGQARCGPNSRGCRMRHRMDAASILMEVGLDPVASPAPLEARGLLDRCRAVIEAEWAEGIVDNARRREGWALINEIGRYLAATEETP